MPSLADFGQEEVQNVKKKIDGQRVIWKAYLGFQLRRAKKKHQVNKKQLTFEIWGCLLVTERFPMPYFRLLHWKLHFLKLWSSENELDVRYFVQL